MVINNPDKSAMVNRFESLVILSISLKALPVTSNWKQAMTKLITTKQNEHENINLVLPFTTASIITNRSIETISEIIGIVL